MQHLAPHPECQRAGSSANEQVFIRQEVMQNVSRETQPAEAHE